MECFSEFGETVKHTYWVSKIFFGQDEFLLKCWPTVRPDSLFPNMSCPSFIVKVKINIEQQFGVQFTAIAFKFFSSLMV